VKSGVWVKREMTLKNTGGNCVMRRFMFDVFTNSRNINCLVNVGRGMDMRNA
jgi:hypothetical protein